MFEILVYQGVRPHYWIIIFTGKPLDFNKKKDVTSNPHIDSTLLGREFKKKKDKLAPPGLSGNKEKNPSLVLGGD